MALITCPECGKEEVSETAEKCPNCGYNIKIHYDKIRTEQEQQIILDSIPTPQKPEKFKPNFLQWLFILSWAIYGIVVVIACIWKGVTSPANIARMAIFLLVLCGLSFFCYYATVVLKYKREMKEYNEAINNLEQYKIRKMNELYFQYKKQAKIQNALIKNEVICPNCGSTNVQMVQTYLRPRIGSYKGELERICINCKYKF